MTGCAKQSAKGMEFSMATDIGGLGDKSFNDGCYAGLEKAQKELGAAINVIESKQMTDYIPNLSGLAEDGAKLVFAVGFLMAESMVEVAANTPDTYFAGIDIFLPDTAPKNAMGILFKEQESGYLAGVLAGLLTKEHASSMPELNDKNVLGMVLGMDIPPVERYQAGFYAGVTSVNPDCTVLTVVTNDFVDQAKGKEAALALIEQGADIVFQIAGLTGVGVINAAKERGVLAIGVDVDQAYLAPDTVITSAEKRLADMTFKAIQSVVKDEFQSGNVTFGINDAATGIAPYHNFENKIPAAVKKAVEQAEKDLKSGKIVAPAGRAEAGYQQ